MAARIGVIQRANMGQMPLHPFPLAEGKKVHIALFPSWPQIQCFKTAAL